MHKDQIISQLIQEKIITISPDKPFTYASGMLSPIYTDLRLTVSYPELRDMIASDLANLIAKEFQKLQSSAVLPQPASLTQLGLLTSFICQ
ncbi:hypothetical protein LAYK6_17320 [Lactobacillus amylovorus subsp. amylovorus]|nr:hypothetical protein LAYK6_17320 [Lactobacillus amylovorus]